MKHHVADDNCDWWVLLEVHIDPRQERNVSRISFQMVFSILYCSWGDECYTSEDDDLAQIEDLKKTIYPILLQLVYNILTQ